jgi:hypothetical protein
VEKHLWYGSDSLGRSVEAARIGDNWFCRYYQYNGYGMSWSKWEKSEPLTLVNNNVEWGFTKLHYAGINNRLRLPI